MNEHEIQLNDALRSLAAELDELGNEEVGRAAPSPPPEIPDFHIKSLLGRGGMGTVYLAEQISLGREVALKVIHNLVGRDDPIAPTTEARTIAQLHHPNIVQVYAAGTAQNQSWFAMELMRGKKYPPNEVSREAGAMRGANHSRFASPEDVARLGVQIAEALAYAHRCGVIHRDVKPSNIFIGDNGIAKLGDFGLANSTGDGGTRRYMAPEMLDGCKATEASDQYALGVTLRELAPEGNVDFAAICDKATAQDPSRRYESMDTMLDDLRRFLAHKPVAANPPSFFRRFRLFARRNPLAASGIVAASILLAAFVAALAVGYIRTSRALAATQREAAESARSLATALAVVNRDETDPRDAELKRALEIAETLATRFPDDETIKASVETLKKAREAHSRLPTRPRRRPR